MCVEWTGRQPSESRGIHWNPLESIGILLPKFVEEEGEGTRSSIIRSVQGEAGVDHICEGTDVSSTLLVRRPAVTLDAPC